MGISTHGLRFLMSARSVDFSQTVTIGRQAFALKQRELRAAELDDLDANGFAEDLFRHLGAQRIDSIDAADFEGATIVHDMNTPIPVDLHKKYTAVLDGGSLEHVFNLPVALANCMNLVRPNGHLLLITPGNNEFGHGFYQFSPELFFRVLSPAYGFDAPRIMIKDSRRGGPWLEVKDPSTVGGRARLTSARVQYLYVTSRRIGNEAITFSTPPQQSDYVVRWEQSERARARARRNLARSILYRTRLVHISRRYDPAVGIIPWHRPDPLYFRRVDP
jgi:hypothetical protein